MMPLFGLASPPHTLDSRTAANVARHFLVRMGVQDVGGVKHLGPGWMDPPGRRGKTWLVSFGLLSGATFNVQLTDVGKVYYAMRSDEGRLYRPSQEDDAKQGGFLQSLMDRVPDALPVEPVGSASSSHPRHWFYIVENGLRLLNQNPTYGYYFMDDDQGRLTTYTMWDAVPVIPSPKPKLSAEASKPKLIAIWGQREHESGGAVHIVPDLGYYLVKGETTARLVWQGIIVPDGNDSNIDKGWTVVGFVDANTGETIRRNPGD